MHDDAFRAYAFGAGIGPGLPHRSTLGVATACSISSRSPGFLLSRLGPVQLLFCRAWWRGTDWDQEEWGRGDKLGSLEGLHACGKGVLSSTTRHEGRKLEVVDASDVRER